jgi:hypothetical protein
MNNVAPVCTGVIAQVHVISALNKILMDIHHLKLSISEIRNLSASMVNLFEHFATSAGRFFTLGALAAFYVFILGIGLFVTTFYRHS